MCTLNKLCRICPNTNNWQKPSKKRNENKNSYTKVSLIEIRPASTAREAIRQSVGQLLEYNHYKKGVNAKKLGNS